MTVFLYAENIATEAQAKPQYLGLLFGLCEIAVISAEHLAVSSFILWEATSNGGSDQDSPGKKDP